VIVTGAALADGWLEAAGTVGGGPVVFITLGCVAVVLIAVALIIGRRK
jgi:hypothetical protein